MTTGSFGTETLVPDARTPQLDDDEIRQAQLVVCANSANSAEALETLQMLGLIGVTEIPTRPQPDGSCVRCEEPCVNVAPGQGIPNGMRAFARHGLCRPCYRGSGVTRA